MQWLSNIAVRRPVFATVLILAIVVVGLVSYSRLGVDKYPKVDFPVVTIITPYPGASPSAVETDVSKKIEAAVNTVAGLDTLNSTSTEGVSLVVAQFLLEVDPDQAVSDINEHLASILRDLPPGLRPEVKKADPDAAPIMVLALRSDAPIRDVTHFADKTIKERVERLNGVGEVTILGGQDRQINVYLDPVRMAAAGVSAIEIQRSIAVSNVSVPGGLLEEGALNSALRIEARAVDASQIGDIVVKQTGVHPVVVSDVANVVDSEADPDTSAVRNGHSAVALSIRKQTGTNTIAVVDAVVNAMPALRATMPAGYALDVVRDNSVQIRTSAHTVLEHLILGAGLASLIVLLFLGSLRSTVIAAVSIPVSVIATFALMRLAGFTLNMMTLLALALAVGIVIDDSIVVLENIYRFIDEKKIKPFPAAIAATKEIGLAVLATTLSLMAVFLPVAFMSGIVGRFLLSFGLTMAFAIAVSMLVAFTLTPMMAARMLPVPPPSGEHRRRSWLERGSDFVYGPIARVYVSVLAAALRHRWVVVLLVLGTCAATPVMAKQVGGSFLPPADDAQFEIYIQTPEAASLESTTLIGEQIARKVRQFPEVDSTLVTIADSDQRQPNVGRVYVHLTNPEDRDRSQSEVMEATRQQVLADIQTPPETVAACKGKAAAAACSVAFADGNWDGTCAQAKPEAPLTCQTERPTTRVAAQEVNDFSLGGQNAAVSYVITGPELDKLERYGKDALAKIRQIPGVTDLDSSIVEPLAETQLVPDYARAATLGVDLGDIVSTLSVLVGGNQASTFEYLGDDYPVYLRAAVRYRNDPQGLALISVPSKIYGQVPLTSVVKPAVTKRDHGDTVNMFGVDMVTSKVTRMSRERAVTITCNVSPGFSENGVAGSVEAILRGLNMSSGYTFDAFGRSKELGRMQAAFGFAILMAFVFMYLVLAAQFESWLYPFVILLALPMTVPFAVVSLVITHGSLNIFSMLGVLVLFGMVKKNAILQVDHANQLRREGLPRTEAVLAASRDRLRPILMTTFAFVAGMAPLVLTHGVGSSMSRAIASIVVGGQSLSLLLTLIAIPVIYTLFDDLSKGWSRAYARVIRRGKPAPDRGRDEVGIVDMHV